jgi:hypothetical protein
MLDDDASKQSATNLPPQRSWPLSWATNEGNFWFIGTHTIDCVIPISATPSLTQSINQSITHMCLLFTNTITGGAYRNDAWKFDLANKQYMCMIISILPSFIC